MENTTTTNSGNQQKPVSTENPFAQTMKDGMNKLFGGMKTAVIIAMVGLVTLLGCKTIPTVDKMYTTSRLIGTSAGMVVNMTTISTEAKAEVVKILNTVNTVIPGVDETFVSKWVPLAKVEIDKAVAAGEMDAGEGELTLSAFAVACKGLDYIFEVRYPKVKECTNLVEAAVNGFTVGFSSVINTLNLKATNTIDYDAEAYDYLKSSLEQ